MPRRKQTEANNALRLATSHPNLMTEWDWEANENLDPSILSPHSGKRANWRCKRTVATIKNTLTEKRSQVPADRAAILYIIIPEEWTADAHVAEKIVSEAVGNFFGRSRRFNAVVLVWEATIVLGEGRIFALTYRPYENPKPRYPIDDTSFLRPDHPRGDLSTLRRLIETDSAGLKSELEDVTSEPHPAFYDWYLLARQ